ncbi:3-isopropylmalate dehydrogenase [Microbacterium lacus]|uniref:3-isopropylmalate dehydrogenase n=1 Tax=Microbacterium lacus TaxID=415217 RepID=UPI0038517B7B
MPRTFDNNTVKLAVIPGDGIGPEVIAEAEKVLDAATAGSGIRLDKTRFSLGAARFLETGDTLTEDDLAAIAGHDAILLGAVGGVPGDPRLKDANIERGLLLKLRFELDHYVNLRPSKLYPGVPGPLAVPGEIDFVVVREGTEGPYVGNGGSIRRGTPHEVANETSVNTAYGIERVVRYAFDLAEKRRKQVTLVHKTNVLVHAGGMWQRIVNAVAQEHPDVAVDYLHVDAATIFLVTNPGRFDVIVTDNLFGDILTDLAGAVTGGIGLAASGNINPDGTFPSMFEPVHGSAPDIAGRQKADPTAAILSIALLLDHLGLQDESDRVTRAVEEDIATRTGEARTTSQIGDAISARLQA